MNWHRFLVASVLLTSSVLPMTAGAASANRARVTAAPLYNRVTVTPTFVPLVPQEHSFELFNNTQQDVLYLHLASLNDPDEVTVYGGTRSLSPGRAWRVDLNDGCDYSIFVEYEDGSQTFYDQVNTCDYRGIQLQ
ncbi:MAG: hypothetical protein ACKO7W_15380 [Elainella sp.]